jgi:anaerobic ribonucleoside-triphosphate reductase activating protein
MAKKQVLQIETKDISTKTYGYIARICTSFIDVPDKIAIAIYFAGCSIRCNGCQNKILWDKHIGIPMSPQDILLQIKYHPLAQSVVFLGGEPTDQQDILSFICSKISLEKVLYTGREIEDLSSDLKNYIDVIICGPYCEDKKTDKFPASSNQRIYKKEEGVWNYQSC